MKMFKDAFGLFLNITAGLIIFVFEFFCILFITIFGFFYVIYEMIYAVILSFRKK